MSVLAPILATVLLLVAGRAGATDYTLPSGTTIQSFLDATDLQPGDTLTLPPGTTHAGFRWRANDGGAPGNPVTIRSARSATTPAAIIEAPTRAFGVEFFDSAHVVLEDVDVTQSSQCVASNCACVRVQADDVTLRRVRIFGCRQHGVLGTDEFSGSITLEKCEIFGTGLGTQKHAVYVAGDQTRFPNARLRMVGCHLHDANGGNLLKSRAPRNELYGNWFEGALYHEVQLIGPDRAADGAPPDDLVREDSDVVGNVIVHRSTQSPYAMHFGGDDNGETFGRVRFVANTVVSTQSSATAIRIVNGFEALLPFDNVFVQANGASFNVLRDVEADWVAGRRIEGRANFVQDTGNAVPDEWLDTVRAASPGFVSLAAGALDLRPANAASAVVDRGVAPSASAAFAIDAPMDPPCCEPVRDPTVAAPALRPVAGALDLGAYELAVPSEVALFSDGFE